MADNAELSHRHEGRPPSTNYTMIQFFEWNAPGPGLHWRRYASCAPYLSSIGISAAWIPPAGKAAGGDASTGYDPYDSWDLGEFDQKGGKGTHWGTKEELVNAIKVAKDNGVITYLDAVLNHKMGADEKQTFMATEVDQENRTQEIGEMHNIEGWTKFNFKNRADKYSAFKWSYEHFTGIDYDASGDGKTGIFKIQGDGKRWAKAVGKEKGNDDFLMGCDIDHAHGDVRRDLMDWGAWILKETGASGFRFDAVPHIDEDFMHDFVKHIRKESGNDNMFCVGELLSDDYPALDEYLNKFNAQFSLFDAPLHYNFKEAGEARENFDLRQIFDGTMTQKRPVDSVTFVDNHDTQIGQTVESWVAPWFKPLAYAIILLRVDGYPCVFYGDLYGTGGENPQPPVGQLDSFIRARKLFAYGHQADYWDHPNTIGWVRQGTEDRPDGCAVVCCNGTEGNKRMEVGGLHAGEVWTDILGWYQGEITIGEDGWADFKCHGQSVSIWVKKDAKGREEFSQDQTAVEMMESLNIGDKKKDGEEKKGEEKK